MLPVEPDGSPPWLGVVPSIDEVCDDEEWPKRVRDWKRFWAAVNLWRKCLTMDVLDMDFLPSDAELAWLLLVDAKGDLRERRIAQALEAVEARRDELAALGAEPPAQPVVVQYEPPPATPPDPALVEDMVQKILATPSMRALTPDVLDWYYKDADERAAAVATTNFDELGARVWRAYMKHVAYLQSEDEAEEAEEVHRARQEELPMNRLRDELLEAGEEILAASDEADTEALRPLARAGKRGSAPPPDFDEQVLGYEIPAPAPERAPRSDPWEHWDEWDWRAYMQKRAARERRHAEYLDSQVYTRIWRGTNVSVTTDVRIMAREEFGEKPYKAHSHEEVMNCITLDGYAVPPERVGLHILDPEEGADYFQEGVRYSPDSAEFLESIGRMRPADAELLGHRDADAAASTTLDESFADLEGAAPAALPVLGAGGARRERDALDPPAQGGADGGGAPARWAQPAPPKSSYEDDDEDDDTGLSAVSG
ncbi:hypothetical protein WJX81_008312 [Elliptochloris bilobata]|uniref:Uncharacterized protein n=1 Tax=Elliptochloris bilobata TaxID=381761 RepID=A0AAW1QIH2_9CHLO